MVLLETTTHDTRCHGAFGFDASHCHAGMESCSDDGNIRAVSKCDQFGSDVIDQSFLELKTMSMTVTDTWNLGESKDGRVGNVAHRDVTPEWKQVMFTE